MSELKKITTAAFAVVSIFTAVSLCSCNVKSASGKAVKPRTETVLGTICTINAYEDGTKDLYKKLFDRLMEIDNIFSTTKEGSELSLVNAAAGKCPVNVSAELANLVELSLQYADMTDGAFNPAIGPLVKLWGIGTEHRRVPSDQEIASAMKKIDWHKVHVTHDSGKNFIFLEEKGMCLDLGAIAKGYAADELEVMLNKMGVQRAVVDLGGNILVYGTKKDGTAWNIGVKNPADTSEVALTVTAVSPRAIVTSGIYERYFIADGIRFHHILDSSTGRPAKGGKGEDYNDDTASVTISSSSSTLADAFSTAAFVMGPEKFKLMLKENGLEGIVDYAFIGKDGSLFLKGDDWTSCL